MKLRIYHEGETPWYTTPWEWGSDVNNEENNEDYEEGDLDEEDNLANENKEEFFKNLDQYHDELQALDDRH